PPPHPPSTPFPYTTLFRSIIRAFIDNIRAGHVVGGGSTITQQLAKQQFLTPDQTYSRKIKELALAYELSQTYSKDQIMELYLNKDRKSTRLNSSHRTISYA